MYKIFLVAQGFLWNVVDAQEQNKKIIDKI